jgi:hypothetical protein
MSEKEQEDEGKEKAESARTCVKQKQVNVEIKMGIANLDQRERTPEK